MKRKTVLFCLAALLAAGLAVFFLVRGSQGPGSFRGSCVKNPDSYFLDIRQMNGTDLHTLELKAGDTLEILFETEKGSL